MVNVLIDEITPCLKDALTGDVVETEVVAIQRKSFLSKFCKKNGWYVNWDMEGHLLEMRQIESFCNTTVRYLERFI